MDDEEERKLDGKGRNFDERFDDIEKLLEKLESGETKDKVKE